MDSTALKKLVGFVAALVLPAFCSSCVGEFGKTDPAPPIYSTSRQTPPPPVQAEDWKPPVTASRENASQHNLAVFNFEHGDFRGTRGQAPIDRQNVRLVPGFESEGGVLFTNAAGPVQLRYRAIEQNGRTNISLNTGSIQFRIKPAWFSDDPAQGRGPTYGGTGPGEWITLFETGTLRLQIDPRGTNLVLTSTDPSGKTTTNAQAKIVARSTATRPRKSDPGEAFWYDCLVTYSPESTSLFWNNPQVASGARDPAVFVRGTGIEPVARTPRQEEHFLHIGSSADGTGAAQAIMDEVVTFNAPGIRTTNTWVISARAVESPPALQLAWDGTTDGIVEIRRRELGSTAWGPVSYVLGTTFLDSSAEPGKRYEYQLNTGIARSWGTVDPFGNLVPASLRGTPIEQRGKLILLLDRTLTNQLQPELGQFVTNLVGDGWQVLQAGMPRHVDELSTNAYRSNYFNMTNEILPFVRGSYARFSNEIQGMLILGHVTIPFTGTRADDGHARRSYPRGAHTGAWPSDLVYGDVDGIWTDRILNTNSSYAHNWNHPGDGRFDQDDLPPNPRGERELEIPVSRIDLARMTLFHPLSEVDLLKRYLRKNHEYRHGRLAFPARVVAGEFFRPDVANAAPQRLGADFASKLSFLGAPDTGDPFSQSSKYLFGLIGGYGFFDTINDGQPNQHTTRDLANGKAEVNGAFYFVRGSFLGDWSADNQFLRAILCMPNGGLGAAWMMDSTVWRGTSRFAVGMPIGSGMKPLLNSGNFYGQTFRPLEILGDSTLRFPILPPPEQIQSVAENGQVRLTWKEPRSARPASLYHVYRSVEGINGQFTRLTPVPLRAPSFTDPAKRGPATIYMVRALAVSTNGAGTFTNISQGIFAH